MTFKKNPSSLARTLAMSALYFSSFLPLAFTTGCQTAFNRTFSNASSGKETNAIVELAGKGQACLDANTPREFKNAGAKLGNNLAKTPGDAIYVVTRPFALVGLDFANNRYFGRGDFKNGIFSNSDSYFFKNQAFFDSNSKKYLRAGAFNFINCPLEALGGLGDLLSHTTNVGGQLINVFGIIPISPNSAERDKILGRNEGKEEYFDSLRLTTDGLTDPVKVPVRTAVYVLNSNSVVPSGVQLGWGKLRESMGYTDYADSGRKPLSNLEQTFLVSKDCDNCNTARVATNSFPVLDRPLDKIWNTRYLLEDGTYRQGPTFISDSIPCGPLSEDYRKRIEQAGLGMFLSNNKREISFHPNETLPLSIIAAGYAGLSAFLNFGGGGSSGGFNGGGGSGGGASGGFSGGGGSGGL